MQTAPYSIRVCVAVCTHRHTRINALACVCLHFKVRKSSLLDTLTPRLVFAAASSTRVPSRACDGRVSSHHARLASVFAVTNCHRACLLSRRCHVQNQNLQLVARASDPEAARVVEPCRKAPESSLPSASPFLCSMCAGIPGLPE